MLPSIATHIRGSGPSVTCPPFSWIILQISSIPSSYTPWVDGYVTIKAARLSLFASTCHTARTPHTSSSHATSSWTCTVGCSNSITTIICHSVAQSQADLGLKIRHVDVPLGVGANSDNFHSCHDSGGRIRPMRGHRDDANIPMVVAVGLQHRHTDNRHAQEQIAEG